MASVPEMGSVRDKSGSPVLDHFDLSGVLLCVWVPYGGTVFCLGSHIRFVGSFFDVLGAVFKVSQTKALHMICFAADFRDVGVPSQFGV